MIEILYVSMLLLVGLICFWRRRQDQDIFFRLSELSRIGEKEREQQEQELNRLREKLNIMLDGISILVNQLRRAGIEPDFRMSSASDTGEWRVQDQINSIKKKLLLLHDKLHHYEIEASKQSSVSFEVSRKISDIKDEIRKLEAALDYLR